MKVKTKTDLRYYEFLEILQQVSGNYKSFQNKIMKRVYENFDISQLINKLDRKIENINRLLSAEK